MTSVELGVQNEEDAMEMDSGDALAERHNLD